MRFLLLAGLVAGRSLAQEPEVLARSVPSHLAANPAPRFFAHRGLQSSGQAGPSMAVAVRDRTRHRIELTLSWKDLPQRELHTFDWIGAFDRDLLEEFHAPVKFEYVFPYKHKPDKNYGSANFTIWNLRSSYVFIYISGNAQYPQILAQSSPVAFESVALPMHAHLALSPTDPKKMLVMWNQHSPKNPVLKWGLSADKLEHSVAAAKDTYVREEFCDSGFSPAARQGWFRPGHFLTAEMPVVPGTTYYYDVGDQDDGFLDSPRSFTAPPGATSGTTRLILFADLGNAPCDGSLQHSWDFQNRGELPSRNSTRLMKHLFDKHDAHAVVHFGDIAYSVGYLSEWDEFMLMIEPVAARIPWMASIGNHEMGWSGSDQVLDGALRTAADSGGECGVAFLKRFPYAMQPLKPGLATRYASPWYSFDVGPVHFTMLSSEHDFKEGSTQWQWMVDDLQRVDRSSTPWLAVTSHRAMYLQSLYDGDNNVAKLLQENVEPQLLKYGVDFFFAGHHHSYQRFCKLNAGKCVDDKEGARGVHHFVMGMAGYAHSRISKTVPPGYPYAEFADDTHWGVTYWEFNQTTATMKFLDGTTEELVDQHTFQKPGAGPEKLVVV